MCIVYDSSIYMLVVSPGSTKELCKAKSVEGERNMGFLAIKYTKSPGH